MIRTPSPSVGTRLLTGGVVLVLSLFLLTCHSNDVTAPDAPTQLSFRVQPGNTTASYAINPAVQVAALDSTGRVALSFTGSVTLAIGTNPGNGTLAGTTTVTAVAGVASFTTLSLDKVGTGYTLTAAATGLTGAASAAFNITAGPPSQLVFTVQPSNAVAGQTISPAVLLNEQDQSGNLVSTFTGNITVALGANPNGANLSGTTTVAAVGGVATFGTLSINRAGTGYTLTATGGGAATSAAFNVLAGPATHLVFTAQPTSVTAGAAISPAVQVGAQDAQGNMATGFTSNITVALGVNPANGTLAGTTTLAAVNGLATFTTLTIDKGGTGYTLTAAAAGLTGGGATSTAFTVISGTVSAAQSTVAAAPTSIPASSGASRATLTVTARDANGNPVSGATVVLAATGSGNGLTQPAAPTDASGVATGSLSSTTAEGKAVSATIAGVAVTQTAAVTVIAGPATQLAFTAQPAITAVGEPIGPPVQVTAQDAAGNTATSFTGSVTATVTAGTGYSGTTLSGATTVAAVAGVSTFSALCIDRSGSGYTLTAATTGLPGATSAPFSVVPDGLIQLAFTVQPSTTQAGATIAPAVQVTMLDAQGNVNANPCFKPGGNVTVALGTNPSGGTLAGTTTVALVNGVATFSTLTIDKAGSGYTLTAATTGATGATSRPFNIGP